MKTWKGEISPAAKIKTYLNTIAQDSVKFEYFYPMAHSTETQMEQHQFLTEILCSSTYCCKCFILF